LAVVYIEKRTNLRRGDFRLRVIPTSGGVKYMEDEYMSEKEVLAVVSRFVERALVADDITKVKDCVNAGLSQLHSAGVSNSNDAAHMLGTAIGSYELEHRTNNPNLFQVSIELERRK
jgi:hypothetical protein